MTDQHIVLAQLVEDVGVLARQLAAVLGVQGGNLRSGRSSGQGKHRSRSIHRAAPRNTCSSSSRR